VGDLAKLNYQETNLGTSGFPELHWIGLVRIIKIFILFLRSEGGDFRARFEQTSH
jgi:hypothetical protein